MTAPASAPGRPVAAVVLAAGSSSRLGTPKQLLRYRGETLLHRTVRLANWPPASIRSHVVLGCDASAIGDALEELRDRVTTVINPDWQTGMGSSLARGIASLPTARQSEVGAETCRSAGPEPNAVAATGPGRDAGWQTWLVRTRC